MTESNAQPMSPRQAYLMGGAFALVLATLVAIVGFPGLGSRLAPADTETSLRRDQDATQALRPLERPRYADAEVDALERAVLRALAPLKDGMRVGVRVIDPHSGQVLVSRGGEEALTPASNTKIFTGAAVYDRLGPDHLLETLFHADGAWREGTVDGDLLVTGGGDPTVSGRFYGGDPMKAMAEVAEELRDAGLREVRGDLVAAPGPFVGPRRGENWPRDGYHKWWMVDVVALPFNDNQITLRCLPRGGKTEVQFDPVLGFGRVRNRLQLTDSKSRHTVMVARADKDTAFTVSGRLWTRGRGYAGDFNVADGSLYYLAGLRRALRKVGVKVGGDVRRGARRPAAEAPLLHRRATPVSRVVPVMLKRSQNLYAELLFREFGRVAGGEGSFSGSEAAMQRWLKERRILRAGTRLADGSGLSRSNRVSPRQVVDLLAYFDRRGEAGNRFREALAEPGVTGTLRKRMKDLRGRVWAKTGTLSDVSALSGYARAQDGTWLCFSILCNKGSVSAARAAQDRVCRALCAFGDRAFEGVPAGARAGAGRGR